MRRIAVTALAATVALAACGDGGPSRADVLEPVMSEVVPARYEHFATSAASLRDDVAAWCENGGDDSAVLDAAIADALTEWYALKPFWSGPVMDRRSQFAVDFRTDPDGVEELLASNEAVDAASLRDRVAARKRGLSALALLVDAPPSPRRCDYALGIADLVAAEARGVADDWKRYGPSAIDGDAAANDAIRDIVSNATFALREAAMEPPPAPAIERGLIDGARQAMLGNGGDQPGLSPLLTDEIVARLTDELGRDDAAAAGLTLSVDVASDLGLTLNFSDADGDG